MTTTISPNMLKTFQKCKTKYYFMYVKNFAIPIRSSIFEKGKKIHALANYYLKGSDITELVKQLNEEEKIIWEKLYNNEYFQKSYVNSEYNLLCKIGDFWIGGRLDAVVKDEKNVYILDYKTGSIPQNPEFDYQTMVYLLCLNELLKSENSNKNLHFVYIDLKNDQNYIIDFDDTKEQKYKDEIIKICTQISDFTSNDNIIHTKECNLCEYRKICL